MGTLNSIHTKLTEISEEAFEDASVDCSTPKTSVRQRHLLDIDPRSPTENIDRTPIIVDGTPCSYLSKVTAKRAVSEINGLVDPRSPSTEFTRTPISLSQTSSTANFDTPVKAFSEFRLPAASLSDDELPRVRNEETSDVFSTEDKDVDCLSHTASSNESGVMITDGSVEESLDTAPLLEGTRSIEISSSLIKTTGISDSDPDSDCSQSKLRCRQINRILGQKSSTPAKSRSPLAVVHNSPRVLLVKKKQTSGKSDLYISSTTIDKENIYH